LPTTSDIHVPTQRYKITIAYRGTRYHGWQAQQPVESYKGEKPAAGHGIPTIQETVARLIEEVVGHPVRLVGSSRTDSGVHAKGQVAHFDTSLIQIPGEGIRKAINHQLPGDIFVRRIQAVSPSFDAIECTTRKRYQYAIWNSHSRHVFFNDLMWHRWQRLDIAAMQAAGAQFIGRQDFTSFTRPDHGRDHTIRTVYACDVSIRGPRVVIGIEGSGFLWNMVRIMVGTLVQVGIHRHRPDSVSQMLEARDRRAAGPTAPPHGLYLQWIQTSDDDQIAPESPEDARSRADGDAPCDLDTGA
jgi:tRNA pseudouridine38-40 synthase